MTRRTLRGSAAGRVPSVTIGVVATRVVAAEVDTRVVTLVGPAGSAEFTLQPAVSNAIATTPIAVGVGCVTDQHSTAVAPLREPDQRPTEAHP